MLHPNQKDSMFREMVQAPLISKTEERDGSRRAPANFTREDMKEIVRFSYPVQKNGHVTGIGNSSMCRQSH
jgi:hypothetical protein